MIHGMTCRETLLIAPLVTLYSLAFAPAGYAQFLSAVQSTLRLNVIVYGFPELSPWLLSAAEIEAGRMLRPADIELNWIDCIRSDSVACRSPEVPTDLIIRLLPKALPHASHKALGIAGFSPDFAAAFIFYDRVAALRTHTHLLPVMLGRVLAHEITNLLLPGEDHSTFGLMRGQWSADDFRTTSGACIGFSSRSVELMRREARRRSGAPQRTSISE
jgi:hypothetical protein